MMTERRRHDGSSNSKSDNSRIVPRLSNNSRNIISSEVEGTWMLKKTIDENAQKKKSREKWATEQCECDQHEINTEII